MKAKFSETKALLAGLATAGTVAAGIYFGSHGLAHFDPALVCYAIGSVLAAFAVGWRLMLWAQRPPSRMYFKRGLQLLFRRNTLTSKSTGSDTSHSAFCIPRSHGPGTLGAALAKNFVAQDFIRRRSVYRWIMHLCLSGGCTLAFAITFPLVFGWIHFETLSANAEVYRILVFGVMVDSFDTHGVKAFLMFNLLNISAVIVSVGLVMAAWRRLTDAGESATQTFAEDILPLILIFAVTSTGLMLTASYKLFEGRGHGLIAIAHTVSVIALLFYIPFGKLFHMFQRACSLSVSLYKKAGANGPRAHCLVCGEDYASEMHVHDLTAVLDQLGFNYRFATTRGQIHFQQICPACRRRLLALNQGRTIGR